MLKMRAVTWINDFCFEIYCFSCETLGLQESFNGTCFGPAFSKTCQYVTTNEKVCKNLSYVSIKTTQ
jgi:hypothetical protein